MFKIKHPFCEKYLGFYYDKKYYCKSRRIWYFTDEKTWTGLDANNQAEAVNIGKDAVDELRKLITELYDSGDDWSSEISKLKHLKQMILKSKIVEVK